MITQLVVPLTIEGRQLAVNRENAEIADKYHKRKERQGRGWVADDLARSGLTADSFPYSDNLKLMTPRFFQVERHEEDFTLEAMRAVGSDKVGQDQYQTWGFEERQHYLILERGMVDSGWYTKDEVNGFTEETLKEVWTFLLQTGLEGTLIHGLVYAMAQEDETKRNYIELMKMAWYEQGCPKDVNGHPAYYGWARIFQLLKSDEAAHEADFTQRVLVYMKYFPDLVLEAIKDVFAKYRMPKIVLSDPELFIRTILESKISSVRVPISVINDAIAKFGLRNRRAVLRALENWKQIPANSVVQLPDNVTRIVDHIPSIEAGAANTYTYDPDGALVVVSTEIA